MGGIFLSIFGNHDYKMKINPIKLHGIMSELIL